MDSNDQESNKQITITITKNHYEKIVRGFHVYFPKSVTTFNGTNVHESDDYFEMDYIIYTRDNIKLKINIFYFCDVDDDDEDHKCNNKYRVSLEFIMDNISNVTLYATEIDSDVAEKMVEDKRVKEYFTETLKELINKEFIMCKCGNLSKEEYDNKCGVCYIESYKRGEDCCVCLEDDYRWIKLLPCNHILHLHCWRKIRGNKCPLCRSKMTDSEVDCYSKI